MKNKQNRLMIGIIIVLIAGFGVFGITKLIPSQESGEGDKKITITIINKTNNDEFLYNSTVSTNADTLGDALEQIADIQMICESGEYGRFIISLCGVSQGDATSGPWWMYSSSNNESCVAAGFCNGIDETPIKDGDEFIFTLSSEY